MPLLPKVFSRRDKSTTNLNAPEKSLGRANSSSTNQSSEYVLPDTSMPADVNGSEPGRHTPSPAKQSSAMYSNAKASSSKIKLSVPRFRKKVVEPEKEPVSPRTSMSARSDTSLQAPSRSSIFNAFDRSGSSHSLPGDTLRKESVPPQLPPIRVDRSPKRPPALTTQTLPVPKTPEMRTSSTVKIFNWGTKPSKMSNAPQLDLKLPSASTQDTLDSFNLKSFRPVRPVSPSPPNALELNFPPTLLDQVMNQSPSTLAPPSPIGSAPRSRGGSVGSDVSQKITVAQFRQAQLESAKNRSSVHLPVPEHPSDGMPPGNVPLHVNLARPISPSFALGVNGYASGNESGDGGTPSRPARLLPPQGLGRSSPIPGRSSPLPGRSSPVPRERTPVQMSPQRPAGSSPAAPGPRISARWMVPSDSDSDSSEEVTTVDNHIRPAKRPPLIPDFQGMRTPSPANGSPVNPPYPSSFARNSSPKASPRAVPSASKSDLGHYTTTEVRAPISTSTTPKPSSTLASLAIPTKLPSPQSIKPGEYSTNLSPSVQTHERSNSGDTWSNTHSIVHSRQNSHDHVEKAKSDLGHGNISAKSSVAPRRAGAADRRKLSSSRSKRGGVSRSVSANVTKSLNSSFAGAKPVAKPRPDESETDEKDESEQSSSDDDAPLSTFMHGRRQDSGSASPAGRKPLISDLSITRTPPEQRLQTASPAPTEASSKPVSQQGSAKSTPPAVGSPGKVTTAPVRNPLNHVSADLAKVESQPTPRTAPLNSDNGNQSPIPAPRPQHSPEMQSNVHTIRLVQASTRSSSLPPQIATTTPPAPLRPGRSAFNRNPELLPRSILREDSPASSIGNSSIASAVSAVMPLTPRSDSDNGVGTGNASNSIITSSSNSSEKDKSTGYKKVENPRRASVTFGDTVALNNGRSFHRITGSNGSNGSQETTNRTSGSREDDVKRNERRRSEAKAAIELGRVVNGPPPVVSSDDEEDAKDATLRQGQMPDWNTWKSFNQAQQMQAMGAGFGTGAPNGAPFGMGMSGMPNFNPFMQMNMNMNMNMPMESQPFPQMMPSMPMGAMGNMGMPNFALPPVPAMPNMPNMMMGADPSMMAAHQQAMMMAKQAYQMAVAQQAMAAAGDEWERSSNMGGFSGMPPRPPSLFGMGMGMGSSMGSPMGSPSPSMYGGSMLGVNMNGGNWGGSVYGENFGPTQQQLGRKQTPSGPPGMNSSASDFMGQPRKRTLTAPSSVQPPAHLRGAGAPPLPPPSSWRPS